jgi:hypothetical protein
MRVSTLAIIVILLIGAVGGGVYFFGGPDGFLAWKDGFTPATTPEQAMEKFRDAIQQRKYRWAAKYCTKDYAELLVKSDAAAVRMGDLIDKIRDYMLAQKLQTDQSTLLLYYLDPFPRTFKVKGSVKTVNDKEAIGVFEWEPLQLSGANATFSPATESIIEVKMFQNNLTPRQIFVASGVKVVKEGEHRKLSIDTSDRLRDSERYFLDRSPAYESELKTFRTYMMNGRYDSGKAFEGELVDALKKAGANK